MSEEVIWYVPYVHRGELKVQRCKRTFFKGSEKALARHKAMFQTEQEAKDAISPVLGRAEAKAQLALERMTQICQELCCFIDYHMEGDTHGIYDDFLCVNFTLDGFQFNYEIDP